MTVHDHRKDAGRGEFLVDGCERCDEYLRDLGLSFDPVRWRAFWQHMVNVEFDNDTHYDSKLDAALGHRLYFVALGLQRAFRFDPHTVGETSYPFTPREVTWLLGYVAERPAEEEISSRVFARLALISAGLPAAVAEEDPLRFLLDGLAVSDLAELRRLVDAGRAAETCGLVRAV